MIGAYPLQWPDGWPKTLWHQRKRAQFTKYKRELSVMDGVERCLGELEKLSIGRDDIVISTNLKTRLDGLPRSDQAAPADPGCAVYWQTRNGKRRVMAIDRYDRVADNLAAIAATLEAMRAIERHGGAQILDRAFTGFTALPSQQRASWRVILGVNEGASLEQARDAYRKLAAQHHPDRGGDGAMMAAVNAAWFAAQQALGAA
jgi:DnaJ domain